MKNFLALLLLFVAAALFFFQKNTPGSQIHKKAIPTNVQNITPTVKISQKVLFVPYWTTSTIDPGYATYVYFGIVPSSTGIDTTDIGYVNLPEFVASTQGSTTLLGVRMLNTENTQKAMQDTTLAEQIIQGTIKTAHTYGFTGVVLDLEYSGLAFPPVTKNITDFSTRFAKEIKANNLTYYQTLYGDTFYLARPFDIAAIAQNADGIFVLAYDFHKANGTPGPNFPLFAREDSDYNFGAMLTDFSKSIPKDKLTIIFGMFGYDWTIDDKGRPEKSADSLSTKQIQEKFIGKCSFKNCRVNKGNSSEISITYTDSANERHIVWFEDLTSVERKEEVMQDKGIFQVGFWANGYF